MKKAALVVLSLSLTVAFSACDSSSDSGEVSASGATQVIGNACPASLVAAYNQMLTDAESLDAERAQLVTTADLEAYKQNAQQLVNEAESFESNYDIDSSCIASRNGEAVELEPDNASNIVSAVEQQITLIDQYEASGAPGIPTLSSIAVVGNSASQATSIACDQMVASEQSIANDAQTLTDAVKQDYSTSGTTSRTTAQMRGELAGFQTQYQSLSCPVSDLSASAFVSMMDTSLAELDSLIGQIPG